jgi:hypothetical protein
VLILDTPTFTAAAAAAAEPVGGLVCVCGRSCTMLIECVSWLCVWGISCGGWCPPPHPRRPVTLHGGGVCVWGVGGVGVGVGLQDLLCFYPLFCV